MTVEVKLKYLGMMAWKVPFGGGFLGSVELSFGRVLWEIEVRYRYQI